jgi:hypothetical protein
LSLRASTVEKDLLTLGQEVERIIESAPGIADAREHRIGRSTIGDAAAEGDIAILVDRGATHPEMQ